jgi:hypothetical protein
MEAWQVFGLVGVLFGAVVAVRFQWPQQLWEKDSRLHRVPAFRDRLHKED